MQLGQPSLSFADLRGDRMPTWLLLTTAGIVCVYFIGGQFLFPWWLMAALPVAAAIGIKIARSSDLALKLYIAVSFVLGLQSRNTTGTGSVDVVALACAAAFALLTIAGLYKIYILERGAITYTTPQLLSALYFVWALFAGIGGIIWWNNTWDDWIREFFLQSPILFIPLIYLRTIEPDSKRERDLQRFLIIACVAVIIGAAVRYAFNLTNALYAYQIGRLPFDTSVAVLVVLVCFGFTLYRVQGMSLLVRVALALFGIGSLILAGYRTMWVATALAVMVLFFVAPRENRREGVKFAAILGGIMVTAGTYLFLTLKIFQIYVLMTLRRFESTTELTTDPSLINRYIETDIVINYFLQSPIVGYGYGAKFQLFDWLLGFSFDFGYLHNGYLFVAFKTGIVGFLLLYSAYFWFMAKGMRIARDTTENLRVRALAAIGFCFLACMLVSNYTLNIMADRTPLVLVGLFWGFFISREVAKKKRTQASSTALVTA